MLGIYIFNFYTIVYIDRCFFILLLVYPISLSEGNLWRIVLPKVSTIDEFLLLGDYDVSFFDAFFVEYEAVCVY